MPMNTYNDQLKHIQNVATKLERDGKLEEFVNKQKEKRMPPEKEQH